MHGAPQSGFARLIFRMRSRTSRDTSGLPGLGCLLFRILAKSPPMPWNDRFRFDDNERRTPAGPQVQQFHGQGRSRRRARRTGVT